MKFEVKFNNFFKGNGEIYMNDIGLVLSGTKEKFKIPIIIIDFFADFWKKVLLNHTIRSIPYSVIVEYTYGLIYHQITYKLPCGKKEKVEFYLVDNFENTKVNPSSNDELFNMKLKEKITFTKLFLNN